MSFARLVELDQHIADLSDGGSTFTVADTLSLLTRTRAELSTLQAALEQATKERDEHAKVCTYLWPDADIAALMEARDDYRAQANEMHARAEKAEAALAQVQGERDATMSAIEKRVVELREWQAHKECRADIKGDGAAVCRDEANWLTKLLKPTTPEREERP